MTFSRPLFFRLLLPTAALVALAGPGLALSPQEMIKQAEADCLESATKDGWRADLAKVISAKALDADKVAVVLDLTKDGTNTARLTCPYSVSQGVGKFGDNFAKSMATTVDAAAEFKPTRIWWLLLPVGLALGSWAYLRGRYEPNLASHPVATYGTGTTATPSGFLAEANARDGVVEVREHPDTISTVLRRVRNSDSIRLTGVRRNDWLEASQGGWVRDIDLLYDRTQGRLT